MKLAHLAVAGLLVCSLTGQTVIAEEATTPMSDAQTKAMQKVIHDYLVNNPEVLLEASQALQQKQQKNMQDQAQGAIVLNARELFQGPLTTIGNAKGNVTLVEFFDYQCIHCKKMSSTLDTLIKKEKNLRVIYKEFPIFGKGSELASKAALAAAMQGKYVPMHQALLTTDKRLDEQVVMDIAKSVGLNMDKLKKDMDSKEVTAVLEANRALAEKLHLMGTPAFIVASTPDGQFKKGSSPAFIPGSTSEKSLQELIQKAASN